MLGFHYVFFLLFALNIGLTLSRKHDDENFVINNVLSGGQVETLVHYNGAIAHEVTTGSPVSNGTFNNARTHTKGFTLWQVADGKHFVQMIYDSQMKLWDCEYITDRQSVREFEEETKKKHGDRKPISNLNENFMKFVSYRTLKKECRQFHKILKRRLKRKSKQKLKNGGKNREKRGVFIYPGTNFCGVGSSDLNRTTSRSDRCCRDHDHCPYMVEGFSTKYNMFNYRLQTLSHCHCDERFRACLKQINSSSSNMIGYLYFNVVKMKCFLFRKEKVCAKRSWWGTCTKYKKSVAAHLKNPIKY